MHAARILVALALCLASARAPAAGFRFIEVPADAAGPALSGAMWYPCVAPPGEIHLIQLRTMVVPGVKDCAIAGDRLPLVAISHGRGGDFVGHHDTAEALADGGFVVVALSHPGDTVTDMGRSSDLAALIERPTDIKRLIDYMLGASAAAAKLDAGRIGFFGFSRGGYTGLALLGANPDWAATATGCAGCPYRMCVQILNKEYPSQPLAHDPRIKAAVIADPLALMFTAASFASVTAPLQLWASARGGDGVTPESVAAVDATLPAPHDYRVVANAGHFVFLTPCPATVASQRPELCADAPGFDRVAFHRQLNDAALAFLRAHL